ncbi:MAG: phosphatase PAP2 family protein [Mycobacteriales bacterium]
MSPRRRPALALAVPLLLLTVAVAVGWQPVGLDHRVSAAVPRSGDAVRLAGWVIRLATPQVWVGLTAVVAAWACRRDRDLLRASLLTLLLLVAGVVGGKALLHRGGPSGAPLHHVLGYYPSGHTATALVCAGLLTRLACRRHPAWRGRLVVASAAWTVLVASSMVVHRAHWLSDVVAGALLGGLVLLAGEPGVSRPAPPEPARAAPRSG